VIQRVHDPDYFGFLARCYADWRSAGFEGEAIPTVWPLRGEWPSRLPNDIDGQLGYYAMAAETSISEGTFEAACAAVDVALTATRVVVDHGEGAAFALCRPPGHHAAAGLFGGYCFLNNAAIATQYAIDQGAGRVAVLDVDFHHGNGTQAIFYDRSDVLVVSLHGDPREAFPHFSGYADETGIRKGEGFNLNLPMAPGTTFDEWREALTVASRKVVDFAPDFLVVSLGVDTFCGDPISFFKLTSDDFSRYGETIGRLGIPTLFVMEGGYAVEEIGVNTVNVLSGFETRNAA
jgi:acetoin utilization deacetylase AcuC-like enzyme